LSVQRRLEICKGILLDIAKKRSCVRLTGYRPETIRHFTDVLDQVIARYKKESERVRALQRKQRELA
jgi:hypothetical protein